MKPLDKDTLFKLVKALTKKGFYIITKHAQQRRIERNFTNQEIEQILLNPSYIIDNPRFDDERKTYKYRISDINNRSVVVAIDFDDLVIVVTVI